MISSKIAANKLLLCPINNQSVIANAKNLLPPTLIRAAEILQPPRAYFSSVATKPDEETSVLKTATPSKHTFDSVFDNLWKNATASFSFDNNLFRDLDELTKSRMDRWMLPVQFPRITMGELGRSLDVWKNAEYNVEEKAWYLPFHVPNVIQDGDLSVKVVKDKNSYMLQIVGKRESSNDPGADANDSKADTDNVPDTKEANASKSNYEYRMQVQLPPPPTDSTLDEAKDYYNPITAHFNKDGVLVVKVPESILTLNKKFTEDVKEECLFSVPIESRA